MRMTKILVIEDEAILREEMVEWLTLEDYEAIGAEDGVIGVECALKYQPGLIVCDITMPRLDGYGVFLELHANPATAHIPFIFLSARAALEDIRRGMTLGADDYITKPFTRGELLLAIETRLEKKAAQEREFRGQIDHLEQALVQEQEERLLRAKLVGMFSHDFRNQLTVIMASATLVRDYAERLTEQRRRERMDSIEASARLLLQMLDDMLIVVQMETGSLEMKSESLNVGQFIQGIIEEFRIVSGETHQLDFDCRFRDSLVVDPRLLRQIVANLVSNAIKYSPAGSAVRITLDQRDGQYTIAVNDQGIGMPEADKQSLFNAFRRGTNVGKIAGTGLGLAIVKQALDLLGGAIEVESEVGNGTAMIVTLPCVFSNG